MKKFIALGCDCSIAYQLTKLGLRTESYPLDWCSSPNLDTIIKLFETNFVDFANFNSYQIKQHSIENFNSIVNETLCLDTSMKSHYKLYHPKYKITLPHEYVGDKIDIEQFETKYTRRIERLLSLLNNEDNEIVFIRLGNSKEKEKIKELEIILQARCKCKFNILYINYDNYKTDRFTWFRDYIPWESLLTSKTKTATI
jgi:hypothetical protein